MTHIIKVFTDGAFKKTKSGNKCGYGIYFPNKELDDISRKFTHMPATNQRAELYAIYKAINKILKNKIKHDKIIIYTDSEYSIKSLTQWYISWDKNGWKNAKNQPVMNQDIIRPTLKLIKKTMVEFVHVNSHTGKQDFESLGNEYADKLASDGSYK